MDRTHNNDWEPSSAAADRDGSTNPYLAPTTAPESPLLDTLSLKAKSSVQAQDFLRVAMAMKAFGVFLLLPALLILFAVPLVGLPFLMLPLAFIGVGLGLDRFKPWAWLAAVLLAVPFSMLAGLGTLLVVIQSESIGWYGLYALAIPAAAVYISWTLLSGSGRTRYRAVIEAKRRQAARPKWTQSADEILSQLPGDDPAPTQSEDFGAG